MADYVWFITGASRGFGRVWAEAALERGDSVVATARDPKDLDELLARYPARLLPLKLDIDDRDADTAAVKRACERFGRIDVLVNNAGYGSFGAVEEVTEAEARAQLETNFFGSLWLTQAVLPVMRARGAGRIIMVSSIGGILGTADLGVYSASKFAIEGLSESLAQEVAPFGIHVTLVEPGPYSTDWSGSSAKRSDAMPEYAEMHAAADKRSSANDSGDPAATGDAILKLVDAEKPPLRLLLGTFALPLITKMYAARMATWESWNDVSVAAQKR